MDKKGGPSPDSVIWYIIAYSNIDAKDLGGTQVRLGIQESQPKGHHFRPALMWL